MMCSVRSSLSARGALTGHRIGSAARLKSPLSAAFWGASRSITSDGPFRHIKPKFTERHKHYNEVLVMADRRKLLETAQEVLREPNKKFPRAFWEVMGKRCVRSMHLFEPLELAIVARVFDVHNVKIEGVDVFGAIAEQAYAAKDAPGLAVLVLVDIFSRRLIVAKSDVQGLLQKLGRQVADRLYELSAAHALNIVATLLSAGVTDASLCTRVARKVAVQLENLTTDELAKAACTFAAHKHRDLPLFQGICKRVVQMDSGSAADATAAQKVLDSLGLLSIDSVPEQLRILAARGAVV